MQSERSNRPLSEVVPASRKIVYAFLTCAALIGDLVSKSVAFHRLGLGGSTEWLFDYSWVRFEFRTNLNQGALWGMGQGFAPVFAGFSVLAVGGIIYWLFFRRAAASLWITVTLALVSGGALGNMYDRMGWHGVCFPNEDEPALAVRDFFHFQFGQPGGKLFLDWAIFNIADVCLVTGAIMLVLHSFMTPAPEKTSEQSAPEPETVPGPKTV
ncbi:MAG: signal peptidase II [Planctomycetaceae bacterium]|nr:signal peptidase II [Planctomycetaceae bacterium]